MQTVLATFDDTATAQRAMDALIAEGFDRRNVHLQGASGTFSPSITEGNITAGDVAESGVTQQHSSNQGAMSAVGNFFRNLFGSDDDNYAGTYAEAVRRGSIVVAVDAQDDEQLDQARSLMQEMGSVDVDARADQWKQQGWTGFDENSKPYSDDERDFERQAVPVVEEDIQIGKRTVDVGGLRVVKRMSETPVSQIVNLREEHATIERRPVDRPASEADFANFREGTIEVRETTEEAVVGKTARVVEEVVVGKEATERSETISDSVRRTDVEVEEIPATKTTSGRKPRR